MPYNRKEFSEDYATETFYFLLSVQVEDEDRKNLYDDISSSVRWFEDVIKKVIDDYQSDIEMERYLCEDYDFHLGKAKEVLENFIGKLYQSLIRPLGFCDLKNNEHDRKKLPDVNEMDIVTSIGSVVSCILIMTTCLH